jgi:hypothetical protein
MSFEFFHKQWVCDFQNKTTNKISENDMLEVTAEDLTSARKYIQISFRDRYFQDLGYKYLFSPCEMGVTEGRYDKDYLYGAITYNPSQLYRTYHNNPKFIAFDTDRNLPDAFQTNDWVVSGWSNPAASYNDWITNIGESYAAEGIPPYTLNLYVFKIVNLVATGILTGGDLYIPMLYMGNDPNWNV